MIYFLQQSDNGPIKIGKTDNLKNRIRELRNASPYSLNLLKTIPGNNERKYHFKFKKYQIKGEWFEPSEELLKFIDTNKLTINEKQKSILQSKLKECLISEILKSSKLSLVDSVSIILGLQSKSINDLATEAGVTRQAIYMVLNGKRNSANIKKTISKALGFNPWA